MCVYQRIGPPVRSQGRKIAVMPFPSPGDLPNPGIEPKSPTTEVDSLQAEPREKPKSTEVGSLSLLQQVVLTQELNWGLLHCRQILYQLSYQGSRILYVCTPNYRLWVGKLEFTPGPIIRSCSQQILYKFNSLRS